MSNIDSCSKLLMLYFEPKENGGTCVLYAIGIICLIIEQIL